MKRLIIAIFFAILIFHGISFLLFVIRMMWFPPSMMGMMMGKQIMYNEMVVWFIQTFWLSLIMAGVILLIWVIYQHCKKQ